MDNGRSRLIGYLVDFTEVQAGRPDYNGKEVFSYSKSPKPDWKPGQKQKNTVRSLLPHHELTALNYKWTTQPENEGFTAESPFREIEPGVDLDNGKMYKLMTWGITPRPVAFVSTMDKEGRGNLAPISWFTHVAADPPTIMISIVKSSRPSGHKDTSANILELKEFCVSLMSEPFVDAANYAAIDAPEGQSEWPLTGLTQRESRHVKVPHVAESAFSMECQMTQHHTVENDDGKTTQHVFFGRVRKFHVKEHVIDPEDPDVKILPDKFKVVARLGGWTYGRVTSGYEIPRPVWADQKDDLIRRGLVKEE